VYGRYDNDLERMERVLPKFIQQISAGEPITVFGGNDKVLDFTYVDDCVEGIVRGIKGLTDGTVRNETINLAYGQGNTLVRVAELIGEATGKNPDVTLAPPLLGEVTRYVADIGRARGLLDWEPSVPLETGIARSVAWFNEWRATHPEEDRLLELDGSELAPEESAQFFKP
jgi:nucleoside-diphosphate-sugar epimerase